jgi:hypothetical protein
LAGWGIGFLELELFAIAAVAAPRQPANMAGPSDKARFYLEQSATELNELERKKIFTRVRTRMVVAQDFGNLC